MHAVAGLEMHAVSRIQWTHLDPIPPETNRDLILKLHATRHALQWKHFEESMIMVSFDFIEDLFIRFWV